ncbi:EscU/YscU/HrcU family type III secretion system export apparatus switch protein [Sphingomonas sp. Tas61C01]|uniref:EscU/YscU/HrcU family type III secretion system export apparatus switch protein n=1 Tax=Sphingomonas sp. Tas61C01 TaxID=3458297 RepID=UPI00403E9A26
MADKDQKRFDPSGKRIADARRRGDTPMAPEMRNAVAFAAMLVILGWLGIDAFSRVATLCAALWGGADGFRVEPSGAHALVAGLLRHLALIFAPLFATLIAFALLGGMLHGLPTISWTRVAPKWNKLSPATGLQRLFRLPALVEFAKTLAKLSAILIVTYLTLRPHVAALGGLVGADAVTTGAVAGGMVLLLVRRSRCRSARWRCSTSSISATAGSPS